MDRRNFFKSAAITSAAGTFLGINTSSATASLPMTDERKKKIKNYHSEMQYRPMGTTGVDVSALGFGMLRIPTLEDGKTVDEKQTVEMLRYAIDHGVNYVDTAYVYWNGQSETAVGKALQDGYRERVYVTSKSPWWIMKKPEDFERMFDESRKRLQTDVIDFYHIHFVCRKGWDEKIVPFKLIDKIEKLKEGGKIRFSGFSFHDSDVMFKEAVDANPNWNFCSIQQNYLDIEHESGLVGMKYAAGRGMGISTLEPLRNGFLVRASKEIRDIFDKNSVKRTPVEWAFDYLWNMPEISVIPSGMSSLEQVKENLEYAKRSSVDMLTPEDLTMLGHAARQYRGKEGASPCTGCYYCQPCPQKVGIGYIFSLVYNQHIADGDLNRAKGLYNGMSPVLRGLKASACNGCGECLSRCPQKIDIPKELKKIAEELES